MGACAASVLVRPVVVLLLLALALALLLLVLVPLLLLLLLLLILLLLLRLLLHILLRTFCCTLCFCARSAALLTPERLPQTTIYATFLHEELSIDFAFNGSDSATPLGSDSVGQEGYVWGGYAFVAVLSQLAVWPLAHLFRQLPLVRRVL